MRPYVLDTNLYIEAIRSDSARARLDRFYAEYLPWVHLHSAVAQELLAGAVNPRVRRRIHEGLIAPFESVGRVITPGHGTWKRTGEVIADLVRAGKLSAGGIGRGFVNDCLIAASARDYGFVLISRNAQDFELIRTVQRFEVVFDWPEGRRKE